MSASNLCCNQPQQRIDSPEPPPRPIATIDGIFAAAALPEDHPHALKFPDRKPELDSNIIRSPNIASKIKSQFRRKSMRSLKKSEEYDGEAHEMTSLEVLQTVGEVSEDKTAEEVDVQHHHRFGSISRIKEEKATAGNHGEVGVRDSVLRSLEYLKPLLDKPSGLANSGESYTVVEIASHVAAARALTGTSSENEPPSATLPKSTSTPVLLQEDLSSQPGPRRSCSDNDTRRMCTITPCRDNSNPRSQCLSSADQYNDSTPVLHIQEPTGEDVSDSDTCAKDALQGLPESQPKPSSSAEGVRLSQMDISQQLRSMSQLSDTGDDPSPFPLDDVWNFHLRERSDVGGCSNRSRHARQKSSSGLDSTNVPPTWGRVRSPIRDTTSSIYSRPMSAGATYQDIVQPDIPIADDQDDLNALFADWPLKPSASAEETYRSLGEVTTRSAGSERRNKPLPPTPVESGWNSGTMSFVAAINDEEKPRLKSPPPPQRTGSTSNKSRPSTNSIRSKFKERFSPPKKAVKKRRSIFKFLRPGSRKEQTRSISTPVLSVRSTRATGSYDGPSEDPALLTIHYELDEQPNVMAKSASMNHLSTGHHKDASGQLSAPPALQRQPTLADYERNLTVAGDDRRRPSSINVHRVKELQEEQRRESLHGLRRRLSRAQPLKDDANPLMAHALSKHQEEKALFRSASKQQESLNEHPPPVFVSLPFTTATSGVRGSSIGGLDVLDPLEKGYLVISSGRKLSTAQSSVAGAPIVGPSGQSLAAPSVTAPSTKTSSAELVVPTTRVRKPRIGTSLESWSRYPSHTRSERCASAGHIDAVISRDFAVEINPEEIQATDDMEPGSPNSKTMGISLPFSKRSKSSMPSSRSMTFSGIVRYYSNLFASSGFQGQNRRTSVTTGGHLEYPELEMLPPQLPTELSSHSHHLHADIDRLKQHVKEDTSRLTGLVKEEEQKIEGYVKKKGEKLGAYMKMEEEEWKKYMKAEPSNFFQQHQPPLQQPAGVRADSPFRAGDVFAESHQSSQDRMKRKDTTMIGPNDDLVDATAPESDVGDELQLDGAKEGTAKQTNHVPSKAEMWSEAYKECLICPTSTTDRVASESGASVKREEAMPPPALKPVKPRSPEQVKVLSPNVTIRRYPSVTVIDDRKGHFRSISLISVKTSRSTPAFERTSTHDLMELIKAKEREEREKLLAL